MVSKWHILTIMAVFLLVLGIGMAVTENDKAFTDGTDSKNLTFTGEQNITAQVTLKTYGYLANLTFVLEGYS